jgi:hypothetical protein
MPKTNAKQNINQSRSANVSIEDLYNKYVKTIDSFRSFAIPPSFDGVASQKPRDDKKASRYSGGKNKNPSEFQESRTHAFYRMVGFPVVSKNQYYNPGYNPFITNQVKYTDIDKAFFKDYPDLVKAITSRELSFKEKINMFRNKTDLSVVYSILSVMTWEIL